MFFYMLIGVPGSGKSAHISDMGACYSGYHILSSDAYIDMYAKSQNKTYSDVFKEYINTAPQLMNNDLDLALRYDVPIIWDQPNLTVKSRKDKLAKIPSHYTKVAIVFPTPEKEELQKRLDNRPGKVIEYNIIEKMINSYQPPSLKEGFDDILHLIRSKYV
jgi:predicted kinase